MEIQINTTKEDFAAFRLAQLLHEREMRWQRIAATVLPPALLIGIALLALSQQQPGEMRTVNLWFSLLILPFYFGLVWLVTKRKIGQKAEELIQAQRYTPGESSISIDPNAVTVIRGTDVMDHKRWDEILRVTANDDHAFFHITDEDAIIIPRRCFPNDGVFQAFVKSAVIFHWNAENATMAAETRRAIQPRESELKPLVIPMN